VVVVGDGVEKRASVRGCAIVRIWRVRWGRGRCGTSGLARLQPRPRGSGAAGTGAHGFEDVGAVAECVGDAGEEGEGAAYEDEVAGDPATEVAAPPE